MAELVALFIMNPCNVVRFFFMVGAIRSGVSGGSGILLILLPSLTQRLRNASPRDLSRVILFEHVSLSTRYLD